LTATVLTGDSLATLRELPADTFHCCITSPPYFGLRDYGVDGQIGLEPTPTEFIDRLVAVFSEVRRTLRPDGTCWIVIGDSYAGSGKGPAGGTGTSSKDSYWRLDTGTLPRAQTYGFKPKDLIGVPWMLAFALRDDGWYLRSDIVWHKPNCMPESVTDRPTRCHEYIFLLSRSRIYEYDSVAVEEATVSDHPSGNGFKRDQRLTYRDENGAARGNEDQWQVTATRNRRDVWTVPTKPSGYKHFATFPQALVEPCILAGCPEGGIVLDPFCGIGTTGVVAERLGRSFVGIELNPEYAAEAQRRVQEEA
jgi:DNA modification methylase